MPLVVLACPRSTRLVAARHRASSLDFLGLDIDTVFVMAVYVMLALGLNIVVGYAGLLDLGYVAFFALGAYTLGWFGVGPLRRPDIHFGSIAPVGAARASTSASGS